jgi:hypothetical protein
MLLGTKPQDEWMTPAYAVEPIVKYLRRDSSILCPFDKKDSAFVRVLRRNGHHAVHTHIDEGYDFFDLTPTMVEDMNYIVSNPPYSLKNEVFEHLIRLGKPFAMLMGAAAGLFEGKRFDLFEHNEPEVLWLKPRVAFIDRDGVAMKSPPFQACYVCRGVLPRKNMFARINREGV